MQLVSNSEKYKTLSEENEALKEENVKLHARIKHLEEENERTVTQKRLSFFPLLVSFSFSY
jgi:hypothetical protein